MVCYHRHLLSLWRIMEQMKACGRGSLSRKIASLGLTSAFVKIQPQIKCSLFLAKTEIPQKDKLLESLWFPASALPNLGYCQTRMCPTMELPISKFNSPLVKSWHNCLTLWWQGVYQTIFFFNFSHSRILGKKKNPSVFHVNFLLLDM